MYNKNSFNEDDLEVDFESHTIKKIGKEVNFTPNEYRIIASLIKFPKLNGKFTSKNFPAIQNSEIVGTVNISYYGPYFLSEDDFQFLDSLNKILVGIGIFSLMFSVLVGFLLAKRLSNPIYKTVGVTKQISAGDYGVRIKEESNTKEVDELIGSINHLAGTLEKQTADS